MVIDIMIVIVVGGVFLLFFVVASRIYKEPETANLKGLKCI